MSLEDLLAKDRLFPKDIEAFLRHTDLEKIKKADLDLVVKKFGQEVLDIGNFGLLYDRKLRESNRRLLFWLVLMAVMAGFFGVWRVLNG